MWARVGSLLFLMSSVFGGEMVVDSPKRITPQWESKVFGIKYGVTTLDNAVEEMISGLIDDAFDEKFIQRVQLAITNNTTGVYEEYWDNGALKARLPYKDGKAHGHVHGWYDNGRDAFKGYFQEGVKQGIHITFFRTEPREIMKDARLIIFNEKGQLDGKLYRSHPTGDLWIVITYKDGIANGPLEGWNSNGKYFLSSQYKDGILQKDPPPEMIDRPRPKRSIADTYVTQVIHKFQKIAQKEFGIRACGSGAGMPFDVETIGIDFNVYKRASHEEARELLVRLKERFVQEINRHEKLRPYLREYPFTPIRTQIFLTFYDKTGNTYKDGSITSILVDRDKQICFYSANPDNPKKENKLKEPYDEAVKMVHTKGS
ncbi:MAG: hypothetical protein SP4CHLAM5_10530 [Chlamydiia bacterium]|nr:hypothetical protein [Chlamydiia bacterium]MCH9618910.1 hypothetical protein [Chlamydiia bacterium]MCH9624623.1 hypothetical protein [Chlamydiia bacterium]